MDMFGEPIAFKFNKKGSSHKTLLGGCTSLLIKLTLLVYLTLLIIRVVDHQDNKNETVGESVDSVDVSMAQTNIKIMFTVYDKDTQI